MTKKKERSGKNRAAAARQPSKQAVKAAFPQRQTGSRRTTTPRAKPRDTFLITRTGIDIAERRSSEKPIQDLARLPEENPHPVLRVDRQGRVLYANPACREIGLEPFSEPGRSIPPEWMAILDAAFAAGGQREADLAVGQKVLLLTVVPVAAEGYANLYSIDVTDRRRKEAELAQINRTLKAVSESSQAMMRARNENNLMESTCRILVECCGHAMVWIGMAEQDEGKTVRPVAYSGFEEGYLETLHITWADDERGRGPTGTAIRTGTVNQCRNMLTDPAFAPWRGEALKRGYASSIAVPLIEEGRAFGAVMIYSREPDPFSEEEVNLLRELANDLAYGIQSVRTRAARDALLLQVEEQRRLAQALVDELESQVKARTRELEEANSYNRGLIEASIDPMVTITPDGKIGDVNAATEHITGFPRTELIGKDFSDYFTDGEKARAAYRRVFDEGRISDFELEIRRRDGLITPVLYNASVYIDETHSAKEVIASARDITRRRQAEEKLRESFRRIETVADISHLLAEAGPNYSAVLLKVAERTAGLVGGTCRIHLPGEEGKLTLAARYGKAPFDQPESLVDGVFQTRETLFFPADPAVVSLPRDASFGMIAPLMFQEMVLGTLTISRNSPRGPIKPEEITLIHTVGDRIAAAITNSHLYSDLKNALAEEQKARQQLMRAEKLSAMGRLLGSVAHELNNPLQTIKNCLYLIQQEAPTTASLQSYISMASSETQRLVHLVAELRDLYRPRAENPPSLCDLVDILHEVRALMEQPMLEGKVRWEQAGEAKGCLVRGEKERIQQVFINLATNAIEAMQPDGGTLTVALIYSEDAREAGVVFRDTGPGIPSGLISSLFEPFITTKPSGLGLGLSICYEIAQKHDGRISVENAPGSGAVFTFWIPLAAGGSRSGPSAP
jgi:PAS domain S-box-containing protein